MVEPIIEHWSFYDLLAGTFLGPVEDDDGIRRLDGVGLDARFVGNPQDWTWNPHDGSSDSGLLLFGSQATVGLPNQGDGSYLRGFDPATNEVTTLVDFRSLDSNNETYVWGVEYSPTTGTLFVGVKPRDNYNGAGTKLGYIYELNATTYASIGVRWSGNALWTALLEPPSDPGFLYALHPWEGFGRLNSGLYRFALASNPFPAIDTGAIPSFIDANGSARLWKDGSIGGVSYSIVEASGWLWWTGGQTIYHRSLPCNIAESSTTTGENRVQWLAAYPIDGDDDLVLNGRVWRPGGAPGDRDNTGLAVFRMLSDGTHRHWSAAELGGSTGKDDDLESLINHASSWEYPFTRPAIWDTLRQNQWAVPAPPDPLDGRLYAFLQQGSPGWRVNGIGEARTVPRSVNNVRRGGIPIDPNS